MAIASAKMTSDRWLVVALERGGSKSSCFVAVTNVVVVVVDSDAVVLDGAVVNTSVVVNVHTN